MHARVLWIASTAEQLFGPQFGRRYEGVYLVSVARLRFLRSCRSMFFELSLLGYFCFAGPLLRPHGEAATGYEKILCGFSETVSVLQCPRCAVSANGFWLLSYRRRNVGCIFGMTPGGASERHHYTSVGYRICEKHGVLGRKRWYLREAWRAWNRSLSCQRELEDSPRRSLSYLFFEDCKPVSFLEHFL